jgi:hypothetical protein
MCVKLCPPGSKPLQADTGMVKNGDASNEEGPSLIPSDQPIKTLGKPRDEHPELHG